MNILHASVSGSYLNSQRRAASRKQTETTFFFLQKEFISTGGEFGSRSEERNVGWLLQVSTVEQVSY